MNRILNAFKAPKTKKLSRTNSSSHYPDIIRGNLKEGKLVSKDVTVNKADQKIDFDKEINFSISSNYNKIKKTNEISTIPIITSIKANIDYESDRKGMDIVMVLDISGSMQGKKLKMVKETVQFLIDELKAIDRLAIIVFDNNHQLISHLQPMTE